MKNQVTNINSPLFQRGVRGDLTIWRLATLTLIALLGISTISGAQVGTWTQKTDMPSSRTLLSTSVVNGIIYAIGGASRMLPSHSTVEAYDPATDIWTRKADMPIARFDLSTSAVNGFIYAIGGRIGFFLSTVEAYDTGVGIRVTGISPQVGEIDGGQSMAITGSGFPADAVVTIGGTALIDLKASDALMTGITPPGIAGEQELLITRPSRPMSDFFFRAKFLYTEPTDFPVTGMTLADGAQAGGVAGRITGSRFQQGVTVRIGDAAATDVVVTLTLITFTIPPSTTGPGTVDVVVTNPVGQRGILRRGYTYNPFPVLEAIGPDEGPLSGGTPITITGKHFIDGAAVEIGGARVGPLDSFSPTELRLQTPAGTTGTKAVTVVNPDGQSVTKPEGFTYNPAPTIARVLPNAGALEGGTRSVITGAGFLAPDVIIGGVEVTAITQLFSRTELIVWTPPSTTPGLKDVTVVNSDGQTATLKAGFTYNPAPAIKRITPDNGKLAGGTQIDILGGGFLPGAVVRIGDIESGKYQVALPSQVVSPGRITAVTPKVIGEPGPKDVVVENPDRQLASLEKGFTYNPLPVIQEISPDFGSTSGGAKLTIRGSGFLPGAQVFIGERPATAVARDASTIEATAPPNPTAGVLAVIVVNPDTQEVILPGGFRYLPPIPKAKGGRQTSLDGHASLYLAPRALPSDTAIAISPIPPAEMVVALAAPKTTLLDRAYAFSPQSVELAKRKPATLSIGYDGLNLAPARDKRLVIARFNGQLWPPVGGTVNPKDKTVTTAVTQLGRYALMEMEVPSLQGSAVITKLTCQPRIFSPNGSGFNTETTISFKLSAPTTVECVIYNLAGELICRLTEGETMSPGVNTIRWNGHDADGRRVLSSMYIVCIQAGDQQAFKTVGVVNR